MTTVPPLRPGYLEIPHATRLSPGHLRRGEILARHTAAINANRPSYRDPVSGLSVLTARFLASRGWCCDSGCRHCPFVGAVDTHPTDTDARG